MTPWNLLTFQQYLKEVLEGNFTPSHLKFYEKIIGKITTQNLQRNLDMKQPKWGDQPHLYVGEQAKEMLCNHTPPQGPPPGYFEGYYPHQVPNPYPPAFGYTYQPVMTSPPQIVQMPLENEQWWNEAEVDRWIAHWNNNIHSCSPFYQN